ncbi:MAG: hypothetical protein ACKVQK_16375 [Burkholderiales bacterium]
MAIDAQSLNHKAVLDTMLLAIPGVEAGEMGGFPAYFVKQKMFACIYRGAVGLRLSTAAAANLQFSMDGVGPFSPNGQSSTREWVQISRDNSAEYEKILDTFKASIEFVKTAKPR